MLKALPGVSRVHVEVNQQGAPQAAAPQSPWAQQQKVPGIRRIVAVASGKGGVGKSTVSVNLACALQHLGAKVGLAGLRHLRPQHPADDGRARAADDQRGRRRWCRPSNHGVKLMSMGFLVEGDQPVIWRGPMIMKTIQQFFSAVEWGDLDILLVDLPPGTGDAQLSLCQTVPLDGGVIVTTPQEASLGVVRKGIAMFQKVNVPILGIVENMSYFTTPTGERVEIFGHGGGQAEAARQNVAVSWGSAAVHGDPGRRRPGCAGGGVGPRPAGGAGVCQDRRGPAPATCLTVLAGRLVCYIAQNRKARS